MSDLIAEKKRILCVEDDPDTCDLLTLILADYELVFTDKIQETLELFQSQYFDLCLLDNWLRDGKGIDLCRQIRNLNISVPIVFISGVAEKEQIEKALEAGAQAYLVKPYSMDELQKIVKELIEKNS